MLDYSVNIIRNRRDCHASLAAETYNSRSTQHEDRVYHKITRRLTSFSVCPPKPTMQLIPASCEAQSICRIVAGQSFNLNFAMDLPQMTQKALKYAFGRNQARTHSASWCNSVKRSRLADFSFLEVPNQGFGLAHMCGLSLGYGFSH